MSDPPLGSLVQPEVGDFVDVYSCSQETWARGNITDVFEGDFVEVQFQLRDQRFRKTVHLQSQHLVVSKVDESLMEEHDPETLFPQKPSGPEPSYMRKVGNQKTVAEYNRPRQGARVGICLDRTGADTQKFYRTRAEHEDQFEIYNVIGNHTWDGDWGPYPR
jgi:hypothetical protein